MAKAIERCECGAGIEVETSSDRQLRSTIFEWRGTHQHVAPKDRAPVPATPEPQPEGNNFSSASIREQGDRNHELNLNDRPGHYGRAISLRWHPEEG